MPLTALAFVACFATGCCLAVARHPIYGLLTYVATLYFEPAGHWWGHGALAGVRWELLPAVVTLAAMLVHRKRLASSPVFHSGAFWGVLIFILWMLIQSIWAIDPATQQERIGIWIKFSAVMIMICGCVDSWRYFRWFLLAHVVGCFYLGWLAYTTYMGGRFEGFGIGSLAEANTGALQLLTGLIVCAALFLAAGWRDKLLLMAPIALIADGIVTTVSRSGFLATAVSAVAFNVYSPKNFRLRVVLLSILGCVLFMSLTTSGYWRRMQTIEYEGAEVRGVDTGGGRLEIIRAQWRMFEEHPLGCGSACTTVLSPQFLPADLLAAADHQRSSHNTFMTMLVDHGVPGAILYVALLMWTYSKLREARRLTVRSGGFPSFVLPAIAAVMIAIVVGDLFVEYPKLEVRVWFVSLLIVFVHLAKADHARLKKDTAGKLAAAPSALVRDGNSKA